MNNALKWGVIYGLTLTIIGVLSQVAGLSDPGGSMGAGMAVWAVAFIASIFIMIKGLQAYRASNGGYMSLGQGIGQGVLIGLIGGLTLGILSYILYSFVFTDYMDTVKEQAMEQAGDMDDEQAEMMSKIMGAVTSPSMMLVGSVVKELIFGFLMGLIGGAILKRERPLNSGDTL